jgi:hypothetical protein
VLTAFDVIPAEAEMMTFGEAGEEFYDYPNAYRAGEAGGWGFALEEFGGDHDAQLRELPAGGGRSRWSASRPVCPFSPTSRTASRPATSSRCPPTTGSVPKRTASARRCAGSGWTRTDRVDLDLISPSIAALDLVTELFGVRLDAATARGPLLTGRVEPDLSWTDDDYVPPPILPMPPIIVMLDDNPGEPPPGGVSVVP